MRNLCSRSFEVIWATRTFDPVVLSYYKSHCKVMSTRWVYTWRCSSHRQVRSKMGIPHAVDSCLYLHQHGQDYSASLCPADRERDLYGDPFLWVASRCYLSSVHILFCILNHPHVPKPTNHITYKCKIASVYSKFIC